MATDGPRREFALFLTRIEQQHLIAQRRDYDFDAGVVTWTGVWDYRVANTKLEAQFSNGIARFAALQGRASASRLALYTLRARPETSGLVSDPVVRTVLRQYHRQCRRVVSDHEALIPCIQELQACLKTVSAGPLFNEWARKSLKTAVETHVEADEMAGILEQRLRDYYQQSDLGSQLVPGAKWSCVQIFTHGVNATGLWIRHDGRNKVLDRVVRKSEYGSLYRWEDPTIWRTSPASDGTPVRTPIEAYFTQACGNASPSHFVQLRAWSCNKQDYETNIYTTYCGLGDLQDFYRAQEDHPMPESFIRYLFLHLTEACIIMENGSLSGSTNEEWDEEIVHRDIKPGNIFLSSNASGAFPSYPLPKIADFGFAIGTGPLDEENPSIYARQRAGTPWFRPPEQIDRAALTLSPGRYADWEVGNDEQILQWSNVYGDYPFDPDFILLADNHGGIGMTIYWLICRWTEDSSKGRPFRGPDDSKRSLHACHANYSKKLISLVEACVQKKPSDRISAVVLRQRLSDLIAADKYEWNAQWGQQPFVLERELWVMPQQEKYRVGFAHEELGKVLTQQARTAAS